VSVCGQEREIGCSSISYARRLDSKLKYKQLDTCIGCCRYPKEYVQSRARRKAYQPAAAVTTNRLFTSGQLMEFNEEPVSHCSGGGAKSHTLAIYFLTEIRPM